MDFLKKGSEMLNKNSGSGEAKPAEGQAPAQGGQPAAAAGGSNEQMDYGDKGMTSFFFHAVIPLGV